MDGGDEKEENGMRDGKKWEDGRSEEEAKEEQHRLLWTTYSFCFTSPCMRPNATQLRKHQLSAAAANGFTAAAVFVGIGHRTRRFLLLLLLSVLFFSVTFTFTFGFWTFQSDESIFAPPYHNAGNATEIVPNVTSTFAVPPRHSVPDLPPACADRPPGLIGPIPVWMDGPGFETKFLIEFKNIHLKCRAKFANSCPAETQLIILTMSRRDAFEKRKSIRQTWMDDSVPFDKIYTYEPLKIFNNNLGVRRSDSLFGGRPIARRSGECAAKVGGGAEKALRFGAFARLHRHLQAHSLKGNFIFHFGMGVRPPGRTSPMDTWYGGLKWQQLFCAGAKWVMKADDDTIVHLQRLAHWTEYKFNKIVEQNPLVQFGIVHYSAKPIRDPNHKWFVSTDEFPADVYPNYLSGGVYLSTAPAISAILANNHESDGFYMDDVLFTGILAERANVTLSDQRAHFVLGRRSAGGLRETLRQT
ncbi:hypothetical protein niasHS_013832 [Heterodera schachtii]|uniref:Hexosyltransferase n=1 Tax=Heterodera schachtii TaxID=97005 RepID=A0ABD2IS91_HETSC